MNQGRRKPACEATCAVEVVPGGPVLVRGATSVAGPDGELHEVERPVVALCACGFTQRAPWCDGTHKIAKA